VSRSGLCLFAFAKIKGHEAVGKKAPCVRPLSFAKMRKKRTDGMRKENAFGRDHFPASPLVIFSKTARISEPRHAEVRGPILTGFGKRPLLHPAHHALLLTGMRARTCGKRSNEFSVRVACIRVLL
jgi:hypothetical protein